LKNGNKSRLLILTGNELFSDFLGLEKQWEGLTKKHQSLAKHISYANVDALCDATQQPYLSSQGEGDWLGEVFKKKQETAQVKEVQASLNLNFDFSLLILLTLPIIVANIIHPSFV
jgi:hypothetical protein